MTFVEHLEEVRRRIMISLIFVIALTILAFSYAPKILILLKIPSSGAIDKLVFFDPAEAFMIHIKIAFFTGLVVSMPVLLYQLWAFISPAIGKNTKKHGLLFLSASLAAFILGASFAFFVLLPVAIKFLLGFSGESLEPMISVSNYVSFTLGLVGTCGLVFEMPVLSFILSKFGIIDHRFLRRVWKYAVVVIFIIAAVVTPTPDIFNMTILALPMLFLYEVSVWVSKLSGKKWMSG